MCRIVGRKETIYIDLHFSLCQLTNHEWSSQLVSRAGLIGWFCNIVSFGLENFKFRLLSAWLYPQGPLSTLIELENIEATQLRSHWLKRGVKNSYKKEIIGQKFPCVRVATLMASSCEGCCMHPVLYIPCTRTPRQHKGAAQVLIKYL